MVRAKFLEHDATHSNQTKIYTDGSKSGCGVGCAVIHEGTAYAAKLPDTASIFTAELTAVLKSLEYVDKMKGRNFTIYSDCYSALLTD